MDLPQLTNLEPYYQKIELIQATADQLIKDFRLVDETITFSGEADTAYRELLDHVVPIIDRLINLDTERFFNLLYTVDLKESKVKQLLFQDQAEPTAVAVSKYIIERELTKVLIRKHFSSH